MVNCDNVIIKSHIAGVVHENPRIGSDGESEEASGASDDVISPVKLRPKNRRLSEVCHID